MVGKFIKVIRISGAEALIDVDNILGVESEKQKGNCIIYLKNKIDKCVGYYCTDSVDDILYKIRNA